MRLEVGALALATLSGLVGAPGLAAATPPPKLDDLDLDLETCAAERQVIPPGLVGAPGPAEATPPPELDDLVLKLGYNHQQVPPLGIVDEQSQQFVDIDEQGRVLVDAVPAFAAAWEAGETAFTAFLWDGSNAQPLVPDGFFQTSGLAMNERGEVLLLATAARGAGTISNLIAPDWTHAVIWKDGEVVASIPAPAGKIFEWGQINGHGHVVLSTPALASGIDWLPRSYLWRDGVLTDLGEGYVNGFNDAGVVAGFSFDSRTYLRWRDGERQVLATDCPNRLYLRGLAHLNRPGQIIATFECDDELRARMWQEDEVLELPTLAGNVMTVTDLNDDGQVVGSVARDGGFVPVFWDGGPLVEVALPVGAHGGEIEDINEQGRFMGAAYRDDTPPGPHQDASDGLVFVGDVDGTRELEFEWPTGARLRRGEINESGLVAAGIPVAWPIERTHVWRPCIIPPGSGGTGD